MGANFGCFILLQTVKTVNADLEERVKALVAKYTGYRLGRISLKTSINEDIGCDGDDAVELFEAFEKEFRVDLSGIQWNKHFLSEGVSPLGCLLSCLSLVFGWTVRSNKTIFGPSLMPVTVGDLVDAAKAKRWVKTYSADAGHATQQEKQPES